MFVQNENFGIAERLRYHFQYGKYDYPLHIHQFPELAYVFSGEIEVTINQRKELAHKGDFILFFPMQTHAYFTPEYCELVNFAFSSTLTPDFFAFIGDRIGSKAVFPGSAEVRNFFENSFKNGIVDGNFTEIQPPKIPLNENYYSKQHFASFSNPHNLYHIKSCLYAVLGDYINKVELVNEGGSNRMLPSVMLYLYSHCTEEISLSEMAATIGYSANYLSHCIKKFSGMSFHELLGNFRIDHAIQLMYKNFGRIIDIALECGFTNERSFYRTFKQVTGETPYCYMKKRDLHTQK
ncbi:MAG: AraC family transcriptional regulator [Clostridiales bacterium]|nr:AraC family transcriptional regulator [Clostridiales bacterium]